MSVVNTAEDFVRIRQLFITEFEWKEDKLDDLLRSTVEGVGFSITAQTYNRHIVREIVERCNRDIFRLMVGTLHEGPDAFKQAGFITFWIRKLKPFDPEPSQRGRFQKINEWAALMAGKSIIENAIGLEWDGRGSTNDERRTSRREFLEQFLYNLRYGALSPNVISQIFYCIFQVVPIERTP